MGKVALELEGLGHFYPEPTVTQPEHVTLWGPSNFKAICYQEECSYQMESYTLYTYHTLKAFPEQHSLPRVLSSQTQQWSPSSRRGVRTQVGGGQSVLLPWFVAPEA